MKEYKVSAQIDKLIKHGKWARVIPKTYRIEALTEKEALGIARGRITEEAFISHQIHFEWLDCFGRVKESPYEEDCGVIVLKVVGVKCFKTTIGVENYEETIETTDFPQRLKLFERVIPPDKEDKEPTIYTVEVVKVEDGEETLFYCTNKEMMETFASKVKEMGIERRPFNGIEIDAFLLGGIAYTLSKAQKNMLDNIRKKYKIVKYEDGMLLWSLCECPDEVMAILEDLRIDTDSLSAGIEKRVSKL